MAYSMLLFVLIGGCLSAPLDDPIRIDLPVYDQPQDDQPVAGSYDEPQASFNAKVANGIEPENYPGGEPDPSSGNFITYKLNTASNLLGSALDSKAAYLGPFAPPVTNVERAVEETEGLGSKALSIKENVQGIVAGLFQPKPIVDTINEEDKYGNTGDKFYSAGQAIVGGASNVSNLVNSVLEVPSTLFKKITRAATEKLNNLGGRLIGL